jgi:hypothetical protein
MRGIMTEPYPGGVTEPRSRVQLLDTIQP